MPFGGSWCIAMSSLLVLGWSSLAGIAAVLSQVAVSQPPAPATVWGDASLRMYCIAGSVLGGILSIVIWPPNTPEPRTFVSQLAGKFVASGICGALACPMALRQINWQLDPDVVLGVSGAISFIGVWLIHLCLPFAEAFVKRRAKRVSTEESADA